MDSKTKNPVIDCYGDYASLAAAEIEGTDYRVELLRRGSDVAVIAPHGGSIERRTSAISRAIAGEVFDLYLFEGLDPDGSYEQLHITSHRFDEPRCLEMIAGCQTVVAVHGYSGNDEQLLLGGRDEELIAALVHELRDVDLDVRADGHAYPGRHARNICNRGASGEGVQLEFSDALRGSDTEAAVIARVRRVLDTRVRRKKDA